MQPGRRDQQHDIPLDHVLKESQPGPEAADGVGVADLLVVGRD